MDYLINIGELKMKTRTRDYRYILKELNKAKVFSRKYAKTLAGIITDISNALIKKRVFGYYNHNRPNYSIVDILNTSFAWCETKEGYEFWYIVYCQLNQGTNIHGEYVGTNYKIIKDYINPF